MSNAVVRAGQEPMLPAVQIDTSLSLMEVCQALATSGYFKDTRDVSQAVVKVLCGQELGIGPIQSMMGIHIIEGKPALSANLLAYLVKASRRYRYRVIEHTDAGCELEMQEREGSAWEPLGRVRWTLEDAKRAGLTGKDNWRKYPRQLCFARALTELVRVYAADVCGPGGAYTPEELGADVDAEGNLARPARSPERPPVGHPAPRVDTTTGEVIDVTARATGAMETAPSYAQAAGLKAPAAPAATGGLDELKKRVAARLGELKVPAAKEARLALFGRLLSRDLKQFSDLRDDDREVLDEILAQAEADRKACFASHATWCKREGHEVGDRPLRLQTWSQLLEVPTLGSSDELLPDQWQGLRFLIDSRLLSVSEPDPFDGE